MKAVIVTGSAGFLGSHLCEYYLKLNYIVIGVDNLLTGEIQNVDFLKKEFSKSYFFFDQDVCHSWSDIENIICEKKISVELIFHFASPASVPHYQKYSLETMAANSIGLLNCLEFSKKNNSKVIFASTSEIYGDPQISPQSESYWGNVNCYGERSCYDEAKRYGESLIYSWNKKYSAKHGIVRIFNTYGPRMNLNDGRVIVRLIQQALNSKPLTIYGDGEQIRSFCYVDDLIRGISAYAASNEFLPMNLGRCEPVKISELTEKILKLTGSNSLIEFHPLPTDDPIHRVPDLSFAEKKINYKTAFNLTSGLSHMISWLKEDKGQQ